MRKTSGYRAGKPGPISLELRLPLLITALLLTIVVAVVGASYAEVRNAARVSAEGRASVVASTLANSAQAAIRDIAVQLEAAAAHPAVVAFLRHGQQEAAARAVLESLASVDSLPVELWSAALQPELRVAADRHSEELATAREPMALAIADTGGAGPFVYGTERVYFWAAEPVMAGARRIGWVARLGAVGGGSQSRELEGLIGDHLDVRLASAPGDFWLTSRRERERAPAAWPFSGIAQYEDRDGERRIAFAQQVAGTPLFVVAELPEQVALARPRAFLRWVGAVASILVVAGAAIAWLLSRSVTRPLQRLRDASGAIARGSYGERVQMRRGDELGSLADTFNHMAAQVQAAHRQLEQQFTQAQALASELAHTNEQLKDAMAEADAAHEEAQLASRAKSEFLATMSHEIRTPINAMVGYTDLLEMGIAGPLTEQQREHLRRIRASGRHLIALVDEVLDLAGIESGRLRLEMRPAPLEESIDTALAIMRPQAMAQDIRIEHVCECGEEPLSYLGDPQRVEQIIVNLVSNAVKFTPAGGRVRVICGLQEDEHGQWTCVKVEDNGVGIPADSQERIFEAFVQLESGYTRAHGGVGLGLAISRHLARLMGGDIFVESEPGAGSCFTLRIPRAAEAASFAALQTSGS